MSRHDTDRIELDPDGDWQDSAAAMLDQQEPAGSDLSVPEKAFAGLVVVCSTLAGAWLLVEAVAALMGAR